MCGWFNTGVHCLFLYPHSWSTDLQGSYYWWPGPFQKGTHHLWSSISHPHGSKILYLLIIWSRSYNYCSLKLGSRVSHFCYSRILHILFFDHYSMTFKENSVLLVCMLVASTCNLQLAFCNLKPATFNLLHSMCNLQLLIYTL